MPPLPPVSRRFVLALPSLLGAGAPLVIAARAHAQNATAQEMLIPDEAALHAAIAARTTAGRALLLAPGRYGGASFGANNAPASIRSADPADPALLTSLLVDGFDGIVVEDVVFSYIYQPHHEEWVRPFILRNGSNAVVRNVRMIGDVPRDRDELSNGLGFGTGIWLRNVMGAEVTGCHISRFHRGILVMTCNDLHITNNEIVGIRMDGMALSSLHRVWITDNLIHGFIRSTDRRDHADMIQVWTNNTQRQSRDIFIRRNVLNSSNGNSTQSIFMRNELVDTDRAGDEMFYRNVVIEENVILNGHLNGITVGETDGLTIRRNTMVQNRNSIGSDPTNVVRIPRVNLAGRSRNVTVTGNIVSRISGPDPLPTGWRVENNLMVQNLSVMQPGHYSTVFANFAGGDPGTIETYRYRADGPAATGIGAPQLAP